jgi:hypothetical protein
MTIYVGPRIQSATGGSISNIGTFTVHTFSTFGVSTFTPSGSGYVDVFLVGGGGRSGTTPTASPGGGGGSVLYQKFVPVLSGVAYTVSVGAGGPDVPAPGPFAGLASTCTYNGGSIIAPGGAGPFGSNPLGSGGGGGGLGANIIGFGFDGGGPPGSPGGGGGGAGGAGQPTPNGTGGIGLSYSISGVSSYYGGGGGGGSAGVTNPAPSQNNFGYGSRGGTSAPSTGRPGIIIIRYIT